MTNSFVNTLQEPAKNKERNLFSSSIIINGEQAYITERRSLVCREMLKIEDLWVSIDDRQVLKGVNFSMGYGEINVLFGPNGAGKTTFMMTLMGFPRYRIDQGKIYFKGDDITNQDLAERARLGLGISFQRPPQSKG